MQSSEKLNYKSDYEKGLDTLIDIQQLSNQNMTKFLEQAFFYLSELKRKADAVNDNNLAPYQIVKDSLKNHFCNILKDHFSNKKNYNGFNLVEKTKDLDLDGWNSLLSFVPDVIALVDIIRFHGKLEIILENNKLKFSGFILENNNLEASRALIYSITRNLMKKEVLLTFNVDQSKKAGLKKLELKADFSKLNHLDYCFNIKEKSQIVNVKLSGIVSRYVINEEVFKSIGEHSVFEILADGSLVEKVVDGTSTEFSAKEILHFSFLFRPISIILPMKGYFRNSSSLAYLDDVISASEQDVFKQSRKINFFSLFNQ